jgi:peptidyl-prolyl cis-trans isomerase C
VLEEAAAHHPLLARVYNCVRLPIPMVAIATTLATLCVLASAVAYRGGQLQLRPATRARVCSPSLNFFDELKKGFEAGMSSPSSSSGEKVPTSSNSAESEKVPASNSLFQELLDGVSAAISFEQPTEEERIAARIKAGEGVVWSADYSRAWRSKNGMPQEELSVEEGMQVSDELSIPIPAEVEARSGGTSRGGSPRMGFADWGKSAKVATASHILVASLSEAQTIKEKIEQGCVTFADAAEMFSSCGSAKEGGSLGSFAPGEMVPEFDAYCFNPATKLGVIGVVDTEFGCHLVRLEKRSLGEAKGKAFKVRERRMLDTPDPETGLRS